MFTNICDKSLHIRSLDPTCVQIFRHASLSVFEILGFKLKNENDKKKNWRNRLFAIIYSTFIVQFLGRHNYILTLAIPGVKRLKMKV